MIFLRPICWFRGHAPLVERWSAMLPLPYLVCGRCGAMAGDDAQRAHYNAYLDKLEARS